MDMVARRVWPFQIISSRAVLTNMRHLPSNAIQMQLELSLSSREKEVVKAPAH